MNGTMSDDQFGQLQTQITTMQAQMTGFGARMDSFDKSMARMYSHMEKRFDRLEETKADKTDVNRIYDQLDGLIKRIDEDRTERMAIISQLNRHDRWHHQTADRLGLQFD
jgi:hypothetical protein